MVRKGTLKNKSEECTVLLDHVQSVDLLLHSQVTTWDDYAEATVEGPQRLAGLTYCFCLVCLPKVVSKEKKNETAGGVGQTAAQPGNAAFLH